MTYSCVSSVLYKVTNQLTEGKGLNNRETHSEKGDSIKKEILGSFDGCGQSEKSSHLRKSKS